MTPEVRVDTLVTGSFVENGYILHRTDRRDCVVIDPGAEPERWLERLDERRLRVAAILATHGHLDHVGAVAALQERDEAPFYAGAEEAPVLRSLDWQCDLFGQPRIPAPTATRGLRDQEHLDLAGIDIEVIATPGHTPGGTSYHVPAVEHVFTGDTLFAGTVGRTDLPGGDHATLLRSLRTLVEALPDATIVAPGHGPTSTIGVERRSNPFFRVQR